MLKLNLIEDCGKGLCFIVLWIQITIQPNSNKCCCNDCFRTIYENRTINHTFLLLCIECMWTWVEKNMCDLVFCVAFFHSGPHINNIYVIFCCCFFFKCKDLVLLSQRLKFCRIVIHSNLLEYISLTWIDVSQLPFIKSRSSGKFPYAMVYQCHFPANIPIGKTVISLKVKVTGRESTK